MNLYYANPSPAARRVRVLLRERGLLNRVNEIASAPWDSPADFLAVSPASKEFAQRDAMQATAPH